MLQGRAVRRIQHRIECHYYKAKVSPSKSPKLDALEFGGLTFRDLFTEQGTLRIKSLMEHIYQDTTTGKMIMIALQSLQMEAGVSSHARSHNMRQF